MTLTLNSQVNATVDIDSGRNFHIVNFENEKACSINNYANIVQDENENEHVNQHWRLIKLYDQNFEIMSEDPDDRCRGRCFTYHGDKKQVTITNWRFLGNNDQRWDIKKIDGTTDLYTIRACTTDLVLTVKDCATNNGAIVIAEKYTGRECQKWRLDML